MKTPVLIPANNEADFMERTLTTLARQSMDVDPCVIVNGCTDRTPDIARAAGAIVLESEHGKMRAIQEGIRHLGNAAVNPFIVLDADSRPFSKKWSARITGELHCLSADAPAVVWGPVAFTDDLNPVIGNALTAYTTYVSWADRHDEDPRTIRGGNSGLRLASKDLVEEILDLDNYWPREDVAIYDTVMQNGGAAKVSFNKQAWVRTSGDKYSPLAWVRKRVIERTNPDSMSDLEYATRAPESAYPYNSPYTRHANKNPDLNQN